MSSYRSYYNTVRNWAGQSGPAITPTDPENWGITGFLPVGHPSLHPVPIPADNTSFLEENPEHWPFVGNIITHAADLIHSENGWYGLGILALGGAGILYLLRGKGTLKKPVNILGKKVKPWQLGLGAVGIIAAGTYLSHESFALAAKKKKKSTTSKPADLGAPGESIGPAATKSAIKHGGNKPPKPKASRSSGHQLAPAALDSPDKSAQPKFSTPSKSHPYLTSHGFAKHPEQSTLSGPGHISSSSSGGHPLGHIVPGLSKSSNKNPSSAIKAGHTIPIKPQNSTQGGHIVNVKAQNLKNGSNVPATNPPQPSGANPNPGASQTIKLSPSAEDRIIQQGAGGSFSQLPRNVSRPPFAGTDITVGNRFTGLLQGERQRLGGTSPTHSVNVPASVGINDAMMQGKIPMSREMMQQMSTGNAGGGIHDVLPSNAPKQSTSMGGMPPSVASAPDSSGIIHLSDPSSITKLYGNQPLSAKDLAQSETGNFTSPAVQHQKSPNTIPRPSSGTVTLVDPFTNQTKTINDPFTAQTLGTRVWANLHSPIDSTASGGRGFDIIGNATTITRTNAQGMLQSQSGSPFRNDASGGCIDTSGNPAPCP